MRRLVFWLGRRLALIGLAVLGAAVALVIYSNVGQAGIAVGDNVGKYTYGGATCNDSDKSDPINVVFYQGATKQDLDYYFNYEQGWSDHEGETQYFKTNGLCNEMDGQPSDTTGPTSRYHGRYHRGLNLSGGVDIDSGLGDYSIAAVHYENWVWTWQNPDCHGDAPWLGNHAVPANGFDLGRDAVVSAWTQGGHFFASYGNWDNIEHIRQCNGEDAWSHDGKVAFIRAATGNVEGMSPSPNPANLWVCYNSPSHTCDPYSEGNRFVLEDFRNQTGIGLGDYSFTVGFPSSLVSVDAITTGGEWFLEALGRDATCEKSSGTGWLHYLCWSWGDERGPPDNADIAALFVEPNPQTFYRGNPDHRPTKENGIALSLDNRYCRANGVDGVPLPGSDGDYTPVCDDASLTVRILEGDLNLDCVVDVADNQSIRWRYGCYTGLHCYDPWYDVRYITPNGHIDIFDLQFVAGRLWSTCQDPWPCDQSGLTCPQQASAGGGLGEQAEAGLLQGGTNVVMDPPSRNIPAVGQQFTVDLQVSNVTNPGGLGAYQFTLQFDPSIVSYVGVSDGSFLGSTGSEVVCQTPLTDVGMVSFVCNTSGWESQRPSGSGQLAQVTFQTVGEGLSPLDLSDVILVDPPGEYITAGVGDGSVSVGDGQGGPVGGIAEYPELESKMAATTPGSSAPDTAALAGSAVGGILLLAAGGWHARRRWRAG